MALMTAAEINTIAFLTPIDPKLILEEIIISAQSKYIVPSITQPIYDDLSRNPALYATLLSDYIKPYLAFCVKLLLYNQYLTETGLITIPTQQRWDVVQELIVITKAKRALLVSHLTASAYPLYALPLNNRITGFMIKQ